MSRSVSTIAILASAACAAFAASIAACTTDDITNVYVEADSAAPAATAPVDTPDAASVADASLPLDAAPACEDDVGTFGACEAILLGSPVPPSMPCLTIEACASISALFKHVPGASVANCIAAQSGTCDQRSCIIPALELACRDEMAAVTCVEVESACADIDAGISASDFSQCLAFSPGLTDFGRQRMVTCFPANHCSLTKAFDCLSEL